MANQAIKRSPFFYVGDKYKLMEQLLKLFPKDINTFYEPFVGGGTVFLNVDAKEKYLNDIDKNLISLHQFLIDHSKNPKNFFTKVEEVIHRYNLSRSYKEDIVPDTVKKTWPKTYFARFNKPGYEDLRTAFNEASDRDPLVMYILLIYGFNRMLRFNNGGRFNLPVGNVDFNKNVVGALNQYFENTKQLSPHLSSLDFSEFLERDYYQDDFIYVDPPYLISFSEYNKLWNIETEQKLLSSLDLLDKQGVKFALSNVTHYRGRINEILLSWAKNYKVHPVRSNYISYNDNSSKEITEVLITNYEPDRQTRIEV